MRGTLDWLFRDRASGRWVVGQLPNAPLWVFLVATAFALGLAWWAVWELIGGVNPFRRVLGVARGASVVLRIWNGW